MTIPQEEPAGPRLLSEPEVEATIRQIIFEFASPPGARAPDEARLVEDLNYTSLAMLELAFALEDEFDLPTINEETARGIVTAKDVIDHVFSHLHTKGRLRAKSV